MCLQPPGCFPRIFINKLRQGDAGPVGILQLAHGFAQEQDTVWRTITGLSQSGVTIIVTTHFMEEAEYCDRIAIQDAGRVLALGTPTEVRAQAGGDEALDMNEAFIAIVEQGRADAATKAAA